MHSPWLASVTPVAPPASANPTTRFLLYAGVVTGSWSGLLSLAVYGIGRATGVPFTVVTDAGPVLRSVDIPTGVLLALMHVITWVLVVPQLARIVTDSEPGMSVERGD